MTPAQRQRVYRARMKRLQGEEYLRHERERMKLSRRLKKQRESLDPWGTKSDYVSM